MNRGGPFSSKSVESRLTGHTHTRTLFISQGFIHRGQHSMLFSAFNAVLPRSPPPPLPLLCSLWASPTIKVTSPSRKRRKRLRRSSLPICFTKMPIWPPRTPYCGQRKHPRSAQLFGWATSCASQEKWRRSQQSNWRHIGAEHPNLYPFSTLCALLFFTGRPKGKPGKGGRFPPAPRPQIASTRTEGVLSSRFASPSGSCGWWPAAPPAWGPEDRIGSNRARSRIPCGRRCGIQLVREAELLCHHCVTIQEESQSRALRFQPLRFTDIRPKAEKVHQPPRVTAKSMTELSPLPRLGHILFLAQGLSLGEVLLGRLPTPSPRPFAKPLRKSEPKLGHLLGVPEKQHPKGVPSRQFTWNLPGVEDHIFLFKGKSGSLSRFHVNWWVPTQKKTSRPFQKIGKPRKMEPCDAIRGGIRAWHGPDSSEGTTHIPSCRTSRSDHKTHQQMDAFGVPSAWSKLVVRGNGHNLFNTNHGILTSQHFQASSNRVFWPHHYMCRGKKVCSKTRKPLGWCSCCGWTKSCTTYETLER